ncbi:MAG TPA: c-type cytochrome [Stellaceae bacterium]|nr:c-type cytochrome [Stellaceae bacterium]
MTARPGGGRRRLGMVAAAAVLLALTAVPCGAQAPKPGAAAPAATPPAASAPAAGPDEVAGAIHVCSSCHGPGGRSISSTFPRLAGQQKDYLEAQLTAFRDKTRADPHARTYMWGMAARLTDPLITGIATYYSSQPPVPGAPDASPEAAAGRKIYTEGIPAESVPACAACHGDHAEGNAVIPRLAGQHSAYIDAQLEAFASMARANEVMHENSKGLTAEQIRDVAAFVRTQ